MIKLNKAAYSSLVIAFHFEKQNIIQSIHIYIKIVTV